jgi:NADH-quinone oxidoreductase subunit N
VAVGALAGLAQTNLKRLWAYSSIANVGYAMLGLAAGTAEGMQAMLVFMALYSVSVMGFFACLRPVAQRPAPGDPRGHGRLFQAAPLAQPGPDRLRLSGLGLPPFSGSGPSTMSSRRQ